jgi:GNAT superfamily N-acetyltransferase
MTTGVGWNWHDLPPGFGLRQATAEDAPLVLALTLQAYEEYRHVLVPESGVFDETVEVVEAQLGGMEAVPLQPGPYGAATGRVARGEGDEAPGDKQREPRSGGTIASIDGVPVGCARWSERTDDAEDHPAGLAAGEGHVGSAAGSGAIAAGMPAAHLHVGRVAVVPAWRGRGVATALMGWFEEFAASRGLSEIRLAVRLTLPRNEVFYHRLGYRPTGRLETREGFGPIALWMSKRLARRD